MSHCHVKGCFDETDSVSFVPKFGVCLELCKRHATTPEPERTDWIIDLGRARTDQDAVIDALCNAARMLDEADVPSGDRCIILSQRILRSRRFREAAHLSDNILLAIGDKRQRRRVRRKNKLAARHA